MPPPRRRRVAIDPAKLRFLRFHWPRYLEARDNRTTTQFYRFIVGKYFITFGYYNLRAPWDGIRREPWITTVEELDERCRLIAYVSEASRLVSARTAKLTKYSEHQELVSR
ncbi:hypothetical protein R3P38DRAFT_3235918 [Favolaschia claudopus]|uniref:Uncharacterized protein n=1 Tax=Favolaschia claudopus TaxID=2862362 RepID=A0AAV9ZDQ3_9AGAR